MRLMALLLASAGVLTSPGSSQAAGPSLPLRGVLAAPERLTPDALAGWKAHGVNAVVVPLDDASKRDWGRLSGAVARAGLTLWPWVEVARSPDLADAHPEWLAAIGGHHDDWRKRFPAAPGTKEGQVIKAWPWVPIGYAPAFDAQRQRVERLLKDLPGAWDGVFLNDLQAGPSSCGCGNDQCRWALDYGSTPTAERTPGDDGAARFVAEVAAGHPGKAVVPVWVTECETVDLPGVANGTGLCGGVPCALNDCWPRYARNWNPLLKATAGPVAVGIWPGAFRRDAGRWVETALGLFQKPLKGGEPVPAARTLAVVQAWGRPESAAFRLPRRLERAGAGAGWVLALDPVDQSWEPRSVPALKGR